MVGLATTGVYFAASSWQNTNHSPIHGRAADDSRSPKTSVTKGTAAASRDDDDDDEPLAVSNAPDRSDCPMCKEYLAGPCGTQFKSWLECTNQQSDYVVQCKDLFEALHRCLDEHDSSDSESDNNK